jgi:flagellar FliJ protein
VKKFKFSFERLLQHKHTLEDVARRDHLLAKKAMDEAKQEIDQMYRDIDESRDWSLKVELQGGSQSMTLAQIDEFINLQKIRIERARLALRSLMTEVENKQEKLIEAAKERKTLEKLRERRVEEHKQKLAEHEMKENDEIVVLRHRMPREGL